MIRLYEAKMDPVHIVATLTRMQELLRQRITPHGGGTGATAAAGAADKVVAGGSQQAAGELVLQRQERLAIACEAASLLVPAIQEASVGGGKRAEGARFRHQFRPDSAAGFLWAAAKLPPDVRHKVISPQIHFLDAVPSTLIVPHISMHFYQHFRWHQ